MPSVTGAGSVSRSVRPKGHCQHKTTNPLNKMPLPTPDPISVAAGMLGGGVLGAVATYRLNIYKERRDRRNEFRGFLNTWLNGIRRESDVWKTYGPDNLEHLCRYSGKLHRDFFRPRKFKAICDD